MRQRELGGSRHEPDGALRLQAGTEESYLPQVTQEKEFGDSRLRRRELAGWNAGSSAASGLDGGSSVALDVDRKKFLALVNGGDR